MAAVSNFTYNGGKTAQCLTLCSGHYSVSTYSGWFSSLPDSLMAVGLTWTKDLPGLLLLEMLL